VAHINAGKVKQDYAQYTTKEDFTSQKLLGIYEDKAQWQAKLDRRHKQRIRVPTAAEGKVMSVDCHFAKNYRKLGTGPG